MHSGLHNLKYIYESINVFQNVEFKIYFINLKQGNFCHFTTHGVQVQDMGVQNAKA